MRLSVHECRELVASTVSFVFEYTWMEGTILGIGMLMDMTGRIDSTSERIKKWYQG